MVGTAGAIIITVLVLAAVAVVGWVLYSRWRAQKLGVRFPQPLPPPHDFLSPCFPNTVPLTVTKEDLLNVRLT